MDDRILVKDIVIPAGTIFSESARKTERYGDGHIGCVIGLSDNTSGEFNYFVGDDQEKMAKYFAKEGDHICPKESRKDSKGFVKVHINQLNKLYGITHAGLSRLNDVVPADTMRDQVEREEVLSLLREGSEIMTSILL